MISSDGWLVRRFCLRVEFSPLLPCLLDADAGGGRDLGPGVAGLACPFDELDLAQGSGTDAPYARPGSTPSRRAPGVKSPDRTRCAALGCVATVSQSCAFSVSVVRVWSYALINLPHGARRRDCGRKRPPEASAT